MKYFYFSANFISLKKTKKNNNNACSFMFHLKFKKKTYKKLALATELTNCNIFIYIAKKTCMHILYISAIFYN
jgi:hypothetical protein